MQSDAQLASILAQATDAILSTDDTETILTWNRGAEKLFGYRETEMVGHKLSSLTPDRLRVNEGELALEQMAYRVLRTGSPVQADAVSLCAGGEHCDVSASVAPIFGPEGHISGISIIARDVSERRRLEEALRETNRQKDAFLAIISHELRTPMTAILGYTDLVLRRGTALPVERVLQYVQGVHEAGGRLLGLVNGLLDYARLEAGAERLALVRVELSGLIRGALNRARPQADIRRVRLGLSPSTPEVMVRADPERVGEMLSAYLSNAISFTPAGGSVEVVVGADPLAEDFASVGVRDSGVGLTEPQVEAVWDRFYQVDASLTRKQAGMGLGLAIVRHLSALHGGRVWAESPGLGQGSTFWLTLPLAR